MRCTWESFKIEDLDNLLGLTVPPKSRVSRWMHDTWEPWHGVMSLYIVGHDHLGFFGHEGVPWTLPLRIIVTRNMSYINNLLIYKSVISLSLHRHKVEFTSSYPFSNLSLHRHKHFYILILWINYKAFTNTNSKNWTIFASSPRQIQLNNEICFALLTI